MLNNYQECKRFAESRRARKLANNTYLVVRDDGSYGIRLHDTEVVIHYPNHIILDSGGWQTVTTKARMNDYSMAHVFSKSGVWYVTWHNETYPYADNINLANDGSVAGEGIDPKKTEKLRKQVNKYSKDYAEAFIAGKVPAPSNGDCWGCLMVTDSGKSAMAGDHIIHHIEEKYYVPSILNRMRDAGTLSPITIDYIARMWSPSHQAPQGFEGIIKEQVQKAVRKFCFQELRLPA